MSTAGSPFRSNTMTRVPSALNRSTTAAPMPAAPPVTIAVLPFRPRISCLPWNYGRRLELDLTGRVEQVRHEDHAHRRIVPAHEALPDAAEAAPRGEVRRLVAAIGGHAADVLGPAAGFGEHRDDVLQRLLELGGQLFGFEALLCIPSDLSGDEHQRSGCRDAVRVPERRLPALRQQNLHSTCGGSGSSSQPAFGCGTFFIHSRMSRTCSASSDAISRAASRTGCGARLAAMPS